MENTTTPKKKNLWARIFAILFIAALITIAVFYFINENNLKKEKENYQTQLTAQAERSQEMIDENNKTLLRLVMKPFAWAIRTEMINENYQQVNDYATEFVKESNVESVTVVGPDAVILVSSNKKMEGSEASRFFPGFELNTSKTEVVHEEGVIQVSSPILGYDSKLGTLIVRYRANQLLEGNQNQSNQQEL